MKCRLDVQMYLNRVVKEDKDYKVDNVGSFSDTGFAYVTQDFNQNNIKQLKQLNNQFKLDRSFLTYNLPDSTDLPGSLQIYLPDSLVEEFINDYNLQQDTQQSREVQRQDAIRAGQKYSEDYLFNPTEEDGSIGDRPANQASLIRLRQKQKSTANSTLNEIRADIRTIKKNDKITESDVELIKELTKLQNKTEELINDLEISIENLKKTPTIGLLKNHIQRDITRLENIVLSDNPTSLELQEANDIISFYSNIYSLEDSPFFSKQDIKESLGAISSILDNIDSVNPKLSNVVGIDNVMNYYRGILRDKSKENILNKVNQDSRVAEMLGPVDANTFFSQSGLADISLLDKYLQDPQFQIFSKGSLLAQYKGMALEDSVNRHKAFSQHFINRLKDLEPKLIGRLPTRKFGPFSYPDFSIFRGKDNNGLLLDTIIRRYTPAVFQSRRQKENLWNETRNKIANIENPRLRQKKYEQLKQDMFNWYRENFFFLEIQNIPEITEAYPEVFEGTILKTKENYVSTLKELLGENGYKELVEEQKNKLENYKVQFQVYIDTLTEQLNDGVITQEDYNIKKSNYILNHNPLHFLKNLEDNTTPNILNYRNVHVSTVPRKSFAEIDEKTNSVRKTDKPTNYYDSRFETVENDPVFKEFHDLLVEFAEEVENSMHPDQRGSFNMFSLPAVRRGILEILSDPELTSMEKYSEAWKNLIEKIKALFMETMDEGLGYAEIDPITGREVYKIDAGDLKFNKRQIDSMFQIKETILKAALGIMPGESLPSNYNLNQSNSKVIEILSEVLGTDNNLSAIKAVLPNSNLSDVNLKSILKSAVTHRVVNNNTMDLPKILRVASYSLATYKARHEQLAFQMSMKDLYNDIKTPITDKVGTQVVDDDDKEQVSDKRRYNAIEQSDSWFNRAVLGNYSKKEVFESFFATSSDKLRKNVGVKFIDSVVGKVANKFSNYDVFKDNVDEANTELNNAIDTLEAELSYLSDSEKFLHGGAYQEQLQNLRKLRASKERYFSFTAAIENVLFKFVRFIGLGYNISSAMTNFFEGNISNMVNASSGRYFKEENYWKAVDIAKYSMLRNYTFGKLASTNSPILKEKLLQSELARTLMDNYDILQDVYNELQKASSKSKFDKLSRLYPKEITNRVEYQIQSQVMLAILMETEIEGKDGSVSNLWDEMLNGAKEGKELGKLSDNYNTDKNKLNYEILNREEQETILNSTDDKGKRLSINTNLKARVIDTIVKFHGDYNDLRGSMASETLPGQALIMFKRWLGSYLYNRFAMEQPNLRLGKAEKGRYRSMTGATGAMMGGIAGLTFFGPLGAVIGVTGGAMFRYLPSGFKAQYREGYDPNEVANLSIVQELAVVTSMLIKKSLSLPTNFVLGKQFIDSNSSTAGVKQEWFDKFNDTYDPKDLENIRANIAEMSIMLWITALTVAAKAMLYNDDDEKDSPRRVAHNIVVNKLMQLSDQGYTFLDLSEDGGVNVLLGNFAALRFVGNVAKTSDKFIKLLQGEDKILAGVTVGQSAFYNQFQKTFIPSIARGITSGEPDFGFKSYSERQFKESPWDDMFKSEETLNKVNIKRLKIDVSEQYLPDGVNNIQEEAIKKQIGDYYKKDRGGSYTDKFKEVTEKPFILDTDKVEEYVKSKEQKEGKQ